MGFGGALLKHSLFPITFLKENLPVTGMILDLGCGDGMLANLLADEIKGARFYGVDLDTKKIECAKRAAPGNAHFEAGDIQDHQSAPVAAVILNDVLHHHDFDHQEELLRKAYDLLDEDGVLILKEVNLQDKADVSWTSFWDKRLYPRDKLNFRSVKDWNCVLGRVGFRVLRVYRVKHFWPASRTIFVVTKRGKLASFSQQPISLYRGDNIAQVLVTGATGFIGEHFVRALLAYGIGGKTPVVTVVVRDKVKLPRDLIDCENVKFVNKDLRELQKSDLPSDIEYVFHLASHVDFFAGKEILDENLGATQRLIDSLPRQTLKRFVFASTMGAIDRANKDDCRSPLDEESPEHPVSFYGKSKLESEKFVKMSGLPFTIVRLPWCYGPGMSPTHHIRFLFEGSMKKGPVFLFNWPGRVSIIEVSQLTRLLRKIAFILGTENQTFFVSDGQPISFGELFRSMGETVGTRLGFIPVPSFILNLAKFLGPWLPFRIKCLLMDGLLVSNAKLKKIDNGSSLRDEDFLFPLARYIHQEKYCFRHKSKVIITGAASGIGKALSRKFYVLGYSLVLIDRNENALRLLGQRMAAEYKTLDLSQEALYEEYFKKMILMGGIEIVMNNAGIGARGAFESLDEQRIKEIVQVNCLAPVIINRIVLPFLLAQDHGSIINIASSAAFQPLPYMAVYSASKAFVLNFSEALAAEVLGKKQSAVEIISVIPSGTATGFQQASGVKNDYREKLLSPDYIALQIIHRIGKGSGSIVIGRSGKIMAVFSKCMPKKVQFWFWELAMSKMR
jgi:short-subunit dehydrogenase/SAM-dependent methyltransferase